MYFPNTTCPPGHDHVDFTATCVLGHNYARFALLKYTGCYKDIMVRAKKACFIKIRNFYYARS